MAESRLQRWSRRKTGASKEAELPPPSTIEPEPSPEEQELAINEALPEREVLEKYDLPDPDAIELGTDITGFMRKEIPELLRRRALRSLWKSNPVLAVLDGLNDYDEDFTDAAVATNAMKTLYKVGQGFDRIPAVDDKADDQSGDRIQRQAGELEAAAPAVGVAEKAQDEHELAEKPETGIAAEATTMVGHGDAGAPQAGTEAESAPRYRPRMRFDH
ncbi:DUF3306 domain-containing protein [Marinobacter sp. TBZ242]|uniref:DUF3306 domain-containing protein n=1 Tax=Marinobacter azerbaijanicus TaxID=3050455 RepID=A0ABT7ICZ0_9GAMM|nr:DUF3306 domain-containing protein [Marinobacter sp. TBZ242]MDL0431667.1 DUF3306 domain-containing protein [Marinobacter sp. TBZ242]